MVENGIRNIWDIRFKMKFKLKTHHELDLARLMSGQIFYRNEKKNHYQKPTCF
jgi:hypothetical protein